MNLLPTVSRFVWGFPVVLPLSFLLTWLAGRWSVGHWPRPMLDDPKNLGPWVEVVYTLATMTLILGFPLFVTGVIVLLVWAGVDRPRRWSHLRTVGGGLALLGMAWVWMTWDPLRVMEWYAD